MFGSSYFQEAYSNLLSSKLRSLLAILGILVGTGSVVAMVLCGQLATEAALAQFKALGTNLMAVALYDNQQSNGKAAKTLPFTVETAENLKKATPDVLLVAPYTSLYLQASYNGKSLQSGTIIGATDDLAPAIKIYMAKGRFISFLDKYSLYCVIGDDLYQQIKQMTYREPLGQQITIGNSFVTIIGVAKPWATNQFFYDNINSSIIIPLSTAKILSQYATIQNIILRINQNASIDTLTTKITDYFNQVAPSKQVMVRSAKQIIESMANQRHTMTILLGLIGSISLIVGGIGVMNIMLVSVIERKREIGLRKAVGAKAQDIRMLFLTEAIVLSLFGGVLGVSMGIASAMIIAHFSHWQFIFFPEPPLIGFTVSVATGIFFGFYPALKAARLDPITALRAD